MEPNAITFSQPAEDGSAPALSDKKLRFALEYVRDYNATKAYLRVGGREGSTSYPAAAAAASRLLQDVRVQTEIRRLEAEVAREVRQRIGLTLERTLRGIAACAFADPRNLFNDDGSPKQVSELDDETAAAIEGIEVVEQYEGQGESRVFTGYVKKYKFARRAPSHDQLMRHLDGYAADNKGKALEQANAIVSLLADMRRSSLPVVEQVDADGGI